MGERGRRRGGPLKIGRWRVEGRGRGDSVRQPMSAQSVKTRLTVCIEAKISTCGCIVYRRGFLVEDFLIGRGAAQKEPLLSCNMMSKGEDLPKRLEKIENFDPNLSRKEIRLWATKLAGLVYLQPKVRRLADLWRSSHPSNRFRLRLSLASISLLMLSTLMDEARVKQFKQNIPSLGALGNVKLSLPSYRKRLNNNIFHLEFHFNGRQQRQ